LQRWLFDLSALKHAKHVQCSARYYPSHAHALAGCAEQADAVLLARFAKLAYRQQGIAHHPLNARLAIEELLLHYRAIFINTSEHVL
jgi:DNA polymerase-3 subunit delta'